MSLQLKAAVWLLSVMMVFGSYFAAYQYGRHAQRMKDDLAASQQALKVSQAIEEVSKNNDAIKNQLETEHENAVAAINTVMDSKPPRVLLPACPSSVSPSIPSGGSDSPITGAGVLPTAVEGVLDDDRRRTLEIVRSAEIELADCLVVKLWAEKLQ